MTVSAGRAAVASATVFTPYSLESATRFASPGFATVMRAGVMPSMLSNPAQMAVPIRPPPTISTEPRRFDMVSVTCSVTPLIKR